MGLNLVRKRGIYTQIGLFGRPFEIDFELIAYRELRVTGSLGQKWTVWKRALALMERGLVKTRPLVSHTFPLTAWREAFQVFEGKKGLKIILDPAQT
jgi:L-iditol 2-dehydrogenase